MSATYKNIDVVPMGAWQSEFFKQSTVPDHWREYERRKRDWQTHHNQD